MAKAHETPQVDDSLPSIAMSNGAMNTIQNLKDEIVQQKALRAKKIEALKKWANGDTSVYREDGKIQKVE